MEVFQIDITGWTASFRYPNLISGFQPTLEVPPLSTVLGLINAAAGSYQTYTNTQIGYYFEYEAKCVDLETIYQIDSNSKGFATNNAKSNIIRREFLFNTFLRLYIADEKIVNFFRKPYYPLVLGRMNDLASVDLKSIKKVDLPEIENAQNIRGQIVPFLKNNLAGQIQALPKYFSDTIPRQNLGTEPFSIINFQSKVNSKLAAHHDATIGKQGVDIFFHTLNFSGYD
jgi:CRISPR-associated protein Cas5t